MGQKLVKYYEYIEAQRGRDGKVALAKLTKVASIVAGGQPDSPELLQRFREAIREITGVLPPEL